MKSPANKPTILYLDDEQANLEAFSSAFRTRYTVITTDSPIEAYSLIQDGGIDIVISDQSMPAMSGIEFLESISNDFPEVARILFTGYAEIISAAEVVNRARIAHLLTKPVDPDEALSAIEECCTGILAVREQESTIRDLRRQNQQFEFMLRQRLLS